MEGYIYPSVSLQGSRRRRKSLSFYLLTIRFNQLASF